MNLVSTVLDFIADFLVNNDIEYLGSSGWNELFYSSLSEEELEISLDLTPMYNWLEDYTTYLLSLKEFEHVKERTAFLKHFEVNLENKTIQAVILHTDGTEGRITLP